MVAWYWLILAFCVGIAFATITDEWCEWENTLTDVLAWIALIIGFVPLAFYCIFLKLTVFHPTTPEKFEEVKRLAKKLVKSIEYAETCISGLTPKQQKSITRSFLSE